MSTTLEGLLATGVFTVLLVFARIGGIVMLMPGIGDIYVPPPIRLAFAFLFALFITPLIAPTLPAQPETVGALGVLVGGEALIGLFIGSLMRIVLFAMHTAGMVIAYQTSLGAALFFDPNSSSQGALTGTLLVTLAMVLIFTTNLHHGLLRAMVESYGPLPAGQPPPLGDLAALITATVSAAFRVAMQVAAPLLLGGTLFFLAVGLLARLMPALQVFFLTLPLQVGLGLAVFMITLPGMMLWYLRFVGDSFDTLIVPR